MDLEKKTRLLEMFYAGVLADATLRFTREGILDKVTCEKREEQLATGKARADQLGITAPEDVFSRLSEVFGCANWSVTARPGGFAAEARACRLCALAKRMGSASPCNIYCLDPMEGMVKGLRPGSRFETKSTLWDGDACRIEVSDT
ncbi:MAG: hypothetical protein ACM3X4_13545 [Ignavibacteriales bacterium]